MGVESGNCKIYTLLFIFQDISLGTFSETVFKQKSIQKKASLCENIKQASVFLFVCVCVCVCERERERERKRERRGGRGGRRGEREREQAWIPAEAAVGNSLWHTTLQTALYTPAQLSVNSPENTLRVIGSLCQTAHWQLFCTLAAALLSFVIIQMRTAA